MKFNFNLIYLLAGFEAPSSPSHPPPGGNNGGGRILSTGSFYPPPQYTSPAPRHMASSISDIIYSQPQKDAKIPHILDFEQQNLNQEIPFIQQQPSNFNLPKPYVQQINQLPQQPPQFNHQQPNQSTQHLPSYTVCFIKMFTRLLVIK